jgi:O-antigen/teichoic acid export membrane protein
LTTTTPPVPLACETQSREVARIERHAVRGMATLALRYGLGIVVNLGGTVVLSRLVGPELWGVWAVAQVVYLSCQEVLGRGVASYLIRKEASPSSADVRNTFALQHLVGTVFLVAVAVGSRPAAAWYGHGELVLLLLAAAVASYTYAWRSIPVALLERDFRYGVVAVLEVCDGLTFSVTAVLLAWRGSPIAGLALALLLRGLLPTLIAYAVRPVRPAFFFLRGPVRAVAEFGLAVAGSSLVNIAILSVPALFVGKVAGMRELGLAQMAFALYANLLFITAVVLRLNLSVYSRLAKYAGELQRCVTQHLEMLSTVMVPAIVLFAGLAPQWSRLAFGDRWNGLPAVLLAQAPGYMVASVFWGVLNPALTVSGKHRQVLLWLVGFSIAYASLTWVLVPRWGALGVALAFSGVELLCLPLLLRMYAQLYNGLRVKPALLEIAMATMFMVLAWMGVQRSWFAGAPLLAIYLLVWSIRNRRVLGSLPARFSLARREATPGPGGPGILSIS